MKRRIKKILLLLQSVICYLLFANVSPVFAQRTTYGPSKKEESVFGPIEAPPHVEKYGGGPEGGGLIIFLSNFIKILMVVAGLFAFLNLILAGWAYISSSGDPEKVANATQKITFSVIGLLVVVASFTLAGIFGFILFGDASAIINPKIYGPGV